MTRIGLIREAIKVAGGQAVHVSRNQYYIDGPNQFYKYGSEPHRREVVNYKVERVHTRLGAQGIIDACDWLRQQPGVYNSYPTWCGDLRVQFTGLIG